MFQQMSAILGAFFPVFMCLLGLLVLVSSTDYISSSHINPTFPLLQGIELQDQGTQSKTNFRRSKWILYNATLSNKFKDSVYIPQNPQAEYSSYATLTSFLMKSPRRLTSNNDQLPKGSAHQGISKGDQTFRNIIMKPPSINLGER